MLQDHVKNLYLNEELGVFVKSSVFLTVTMFLRVDLRNKKELMDGFQVLLFRTTYRLFWKEGLKKMEKS